MIDPNTLSLPDNPSLFTRLSVALQAVKRVRGDEGNPVYGQLIQDSLDRNVYESLAQRFQRSGEGRRMLSERPSLQAKDLDLGALERLPEDTLGHEFARYFRDNKISPFETTLELESDADFISKRYRETHDLMHAVTGYGTDVVGEMELQAYVLGNLGLPAAMFIVVIGTLGQLKEPQPGVDLSAYLRRVWAAYHRGREAPLFLDFRFEEHWETPMAKVRAWLCTPIREKVPVHG